MRASEIRQGFAAVLAMRRPRHLVHVGAHEGEELALYRQVGIPRVTAIEPIPRLAAKLRIHHPDVEVIQAACSDHVGEAVLHVPVRSNMASLVDAPPGPASTITVPTVRLDEVCPDADAAVIDVQGHEFAVLAAAPWDSLRLLMVETLHGVEDPALSPPYGDMVTYMADRGFREVACFPRDYDWVQRWAYGRTTSTGGEVRDVVFVKADR